MSLSAAPQPASIRLTVNLLPALHPPEVSGGTALVIDVLRATTTAATFLEHSADTVVFAPSIEAALAARDTLGAGVRLAGERGGVRVPGFDMGNSPREAAAHHWGSHTTIVMNTTNGTAAAHTAAATADHVLLACLRNAPAAAARALALGGDLTVVCAGTDGHVSLDDCYAAGVLVREVLAAGGGPEAFRLNDSAQMVLALLAQWPDPLAALRASTHGQRLLGLGDLDLALSDLALDVNFCAELGVSRVVPELREASAEGLKFCAQGS